ncbi:MAG: L-threonylcarbamoyladenylate synthase [Bowdeniella nasicola]|nr:L-threonylcarbamoyladenylate synthase [Bowdeniella nasicola]
MARFFEMHPVTPQARYLKQIADILAADGVIAYPTDSGYALGCKLGNKSGLDRIRQIRQLTKRHHFTLVCANFAQLGKLVIVNNPSYRLIKRLTPGPFTFILPGTKEVPRMTLNPKKNTVGARIPDHVIAQEILAAHGAALLSSTLIPPAEDEPMTEAWQIDQQYGHLLDAIVSGPVTMPEPTTVVDLTGRDVVILRQGAGQLD